MATINNVSSSHLTNLGEHRGSVLERRNENAEARERMRVQREEQSEARVAAAAVATQQATQQAEGLFSYMNHNSGGNNGLWGAGTFNTDVFFNSGGELAQLQAMNSARIGIENRARTLAGEIGRDRARGFDVSDKQEALGNLTGNLDILSRNLSNSVDRALSDDGRREANTIDIIGRIRESLAPTPAPEAETATQAANAATETQASDTGIGTSMLAAPEGTVSEKIAEASQERDPAEMSAAEIIAQNAKSDHAESIDIMAEDFDSSGDSSGSATNAIDE